MRIAIGQIDPVVGDFEGNVRKIAEAYGRACADGARVLVTPEMGVCGYPLHDLMIRPEIYDRNNAAVQDLARLTQGKRCALAVGHVVRNPEPMGRPAFNRVSVLEAGKIVFTQAKSLLPTYDVFDEARYFEPGRETLPWNCDGTRVGLAVCEDLWVADPALRSLYDRDPVADHETNRVQVLISLSASPYQWAKRENRERIHAQIATRLKAPLVYVNQVGATDEILFDGSSFACDGAGQLTGRLPVFQVGYGVVGVGSGDRAAWSSPPEGRENTPPTDMETLVRGLVIGIQEYFKRTGFKTAVIGLSGGIDSAVTATLAVRALGAKNVYGVAMPSQYSSVHSIEDAERLARNLGIPFEVRPIKFAFATLSREMGEARGGQLAPIALENLQARIRGMTLMTLANHYGGLVLTTGNKSELAVGYCTLYGDMVGALAPIADLFKTRVYELARYLNQQWGAPIPQGSLTKPPSAELRPDQKDEDSLPPYDELDLALEDYLEKGVPRSELLQKYPSWISGVLRLVELSEFKRRQAAPPLKTSVRAFGIGRRIPIAKAWL